MLCWVPKGLKPHSPRERHLRVLLGPHSILQLRICDRGWESPRGEFPASAWFRSAVGTGGGWGRPFLKGTGEAFGRRRGNSVPEERITND